MDSGEALRAPYNSAIRVHPADLQPDRIEQTYERVHTQMGFATPSVLADPIKGMIFEAALAVTAHDTQRAAQAPQGDVAHPFETLSNAQPQPTEESQAFFDAQVDAFNVYAALDALITNVGAADVALERLQSLQASSARPTLIEVGDALADITGMDGYSLTDITARSGAIGLMHALNFEQGYAQELAEVSAVLAMNNFPLNDLANWSIGRSRAGMIDASAEDKIIVGQEARAGLVLEYLAQQSPEHTPCDYAEPHYQDIKAALDAVPAPLAELFFEMNGTVIFDAECTQHNPETQLSGNSVYHYDPGKEYDAINIKYVSGDMNVRDVQLTLIHELHHNFFPDLIDNNTAKQADVMVAADNTRIEQLYEKSWELVDAIKNGILDDQARILDDINSYSVSGQPTFADIVKDMDMREAAAQLIPLIDDAYNHVRLESDAYKGIASYERPEQLAGELIPRYAEIRFGNGDIGEALAEFIMPNISKVYDKVYIPHIAEKLEQVKAEHRAMQSEPDNYANNISYEFPIMQADALAQSL